MAAKAVNILVLHTSATTGTIRNDILKFNHGKDASSWPDPLKPYNPSNRLKPWEAFPTLLVDFPMCDPEWFCTCVAPDFLLRQEASAVENHITRNCPMIAASSPWPNLRLDNGLTHWKWCLLEIHIVLIREQSARESVWQTRQHLRSLWLNRRAI